MNSPHGIDEDENPTSKARELPGSEKNDRHFATGHLLKNLRQRTISSSIVTMGAQGTLFFLNLGSVMILARMLPPQDFGLIAMVMTLMSFLRIFKDGGLSTATVQREGITHAQVSNLFWINVGLSCFIGLLVAMSGPAIAWFYREPRLTGITLALSCTFVLEGAVTQHLALFNRQMRFGTIAVIQISSMIAGVFVGISMAWLACGYWSLVGLQLTTPTVAFLLIWANSPWRPQFPTRGAGTRSLVTFGANLAASGLIWTLARSTDGVLVGRFFGSNSLGLYSRASILLHRPMEQLLGPIEAVFLPMFCRIRPEPDRYRRVVIQVYETVALISFFLTGLILAVARPLILVLLGQKWSQAIPIFLGFAIGAVFLPLSYSSTWLFVSQGRGKDWLTANMIVSALTVCGTIAGLAFGPTGVAFAYSLSGLLLVVPIMYYFAGREGPVQSKDLWIATLKHLPTWAITFGATFLSVDSLRAKSPVAQLAISIPIGLLAGAGFVCAYPPARKVIFHLFSVLKKNPESAN